MKLHEKNVPKSVQKCPINSPKGKEFFRTCNVLPFSCTHLALWRGKGKVKDPRYMQNKKDSRISLPKGDYISFLAQRVRK
jgi:hypothetical protein